MANASFDLLVWNFEDQIDSVKHILYDLLLQDDPQTDASQVPNLKRIIKSPSRSDETLISSQSIELARRMVKHKFGKVLSIQPFLPPPKNPGPDYKPVPHRGVIRNEAFDGSSNPATNVQLRYVDNGPYTSGGAVKSESRHTEYKRCGTTRYSIGLMENNVAKYVSGFLNSDGGKLILGINDNCKVDGVPYERSDDVQRKGEEDRNLELAIQKFIGFMHPQVPSRLFNISFYREEQMVKRVVEISVEKNDTCDLYFTPCGNMFMRREGSIQVILSKNVYEVAKQALEQKFESELEDLRRRKKNSRDLFLRKVDHEQGLPGEIDREEQARLQSIEQFNQTRKEVRKLDEKIAVFDRERPYLKHHVDNLVSYEYSIERSVDLINRQAERLLSVEYKARNQKWFDEVKRLEHQIRHMALEENNVWRTLPNPFRPA